MVKLKKSIHSVNNNPIVVVYGDTYPIYKSLGKSGLGFTWFGAYKFWWLYERDFTPDKLNALKKLGVDTTEYDGGTQPTPMASPEKVISTYQENLLPKKENLTNKTDVDNDAPSQKYYGFPVNKNIYSATWEMNIDDEKFPIKVIMGRSFEKGVRKIPLYRYTAIYNEISLGTISEKAPGNYGTYDEDASVKDIPAKIQARFDAKEKSKIYLRFKTQKRLELRDPQFIQFLETWKSLYGKKEEEEKKFIEDNLGTFGIEINKNGYAGFFPIELNNLGNSIYFETKVDHLLAPYRKTLGSLEIHSSIKTIQELKDIIQKSIEVNKSSMEEEYLKYLKSFPYKQEEQQKSEMEMQKIVDMIIHNFVDLGEIQKELEQRGFIRKSQRGEGWIITKDAMEAGYKSGNSADQFYGAVAYWLHRKKHNITSITEMMLVTAVSTLVDLLKRYGYTLDFREVNNFLENRIVNPLFKQLFNENPPKSQAENYRDFYSGNWGGTSGRGQVSTISPSVNALDDFVNYAIQLGANAEETKSNPKSVYRKLSLQFHPSSTLNATKSPEERNLLEKTFGELSQKFNALPDNLRRANNWYQRVKE